MGQQARRLRRRVSDVVRNRQAVALGLALLAVLAPATLSRSHPTGAPEGELRSDRVERAAPGEASVASVHQGRVAARGVQARSDRGTKPTVLYLKKARSGAYDLRKLKGVVVKRERPEFGAPVEATGSRSAAPGSAIALPGPVPIATTPAPAPDLTFPGLDFATWGAGHPPDTNGDVGPTYYIETVNTSLGIFDKSSGNRVAAFTFNAFMSQGQFGNLCDTDNFGDPVVLYDSFEDRWFVTDFAFKLDGFGNVNPQHVYQCFAVSKTGDPVTGGWNFYSIESVGALDDYPKFGVWPDGIYMSANLFGYLAGSSYQGTRVWAIDKAEMYAGASSVQVASFDGPPSDFTLLPGNSRLQTGTPPTGGPEFFVSTEQFLNALSIYKLQVDWDKISTSTFTGPETQLAPTCWPNATPANASTTANTADVLAIRAMAQAQYSNIGGAESLWIAHTVQRGESATNSNCNASTGGNATVRWYQANVTGGAVAASTVQGRSYDPEGANTFFRFMPSLAVDRVGDMAVGYTKSNATTNPQLKYAGRLAGDPVNTFSQSEQTLIDGTGSQSGNCGASACTRWGDYSGMALDPDGCEFWATGEYYITSGLNDQTRIGSFKFPGCTTVGNGTLSGTVTDGTHALAGATVALGSRTVTTDASGNYSFTVPAGTYPALSASKAGFDASSPSSVTVPNNGTTTRNITLGTAAVSGCFTDNTQAAFQRGFPTGCDLTASPGGVVLVNPTAVDQQNATVTNSGFGFTSTSWAGQTFTPSVTGVATKIDLDLFCSACTGTTPNLTVSIRATTSGVPTGSDLASATILGFNSGSGGFFSANFASPITLNAGTSYAVVFRSVSNVSAGTYAYVVSSANPYTAGQRVTSTNSGTNWTPDTTSGGRDLGFKIWMNSGYVSSGTFVSSLKDANPTAGNTPHWTTLSFSATTPGGTGVKLQVAGSNAQSGPFNFVGPDGTAQTFFTTSGASLAQFDGFRYLEYEAFLSTGSNSVTPMLSSVSVCFQNGSATTGLGVDPATGTYGGTTSLTATLSAASVGVPGKSVDFALNGSSVGSAVTDGSGVATLSGVSLVGIAAGSYLGAVTASFAGDSSNGASNGASSLAVDPQPLTITAGDRTKAYGDTLDLGTTAFTATGIVNGEGISSVTLSSVGAGSDAAVGAYPIVPSAAVPAGGTDLANYSLSYVNGTLTVTGVTSNGPTVKITTPPEGAAYGLGAVVKAAYACTPIEKVAVISCVGTVAKGTAIDTTAGPHTFTVTGTDRKGRQTVVTTHYTVTYRWTGFYAPVANDSATKLNVVHGGDLIKVEFALNGDRGLSVLATASPTSTQVACPGWSTTPKIAAAASGTPTGLFYQPASLRYGFGWATSGAWAGTCRQFSLQLNDGTPPHTATFKFAG
jgi:hypothetical protein